VKAEAMNQTHHHCVERYTARAHNNWLSERLNLGSQTEVSRNFSRYSAQ